MRKASALGLVLVVFLVGLAAGLLGGRLLREPMLGSRDSHGPPHLRHYFLRGDFDLSDEQQERLEEIFRRRHSEVEELHQRLRPEVEGLMDRTQREIEAVLTPEQLERFRERHKRWNRRPRWRDHRPPPADRQNPRKEPAEDAGGSDSH